MIDFPFPPLNVCPNTTKQKQYRKNKQQYAACYELLAHQHKSIHNFLLLGEAYMNIQEPEKAVKAYEVEVECRMAVCPLFMSFYMLAVHLCCLYDC